MPVLEGFSIGFIKILKLEQEKRHGILARYIQV
nr:MAG TPA: hypothetical protein [Caudoviricetes sp.]